MMYVGITSVVLIFLNLYAATTMRNLVFRSKETSLEDKVQMAASAFVPYRRRALKKLWTSWET